MDRSTLMDLSMATGEKFSYCQNNFLDYNL